ncbi:MAG TPA: hypothetical protein EYO33_22280 [Phycisphaerales bacterium]|jgi:hypothetical protein|nr:hypothetical protein [Phycisphaerales bacterium]
MPAIQSTVVDTSADTNVFTGTDIDTIPYPGLLQLWAASTVNTATYTISIGDITTVRSVSLPLRTSGLPKINEDPPLFEGLVDGGHVAAILAGTTGTVYSIARLTPLEDL